MDIEGRVQRKKLVLDNAAKLFNEWVDRYKTDYDKESKGKDESWKEKYDYKNFDNLAELQLASPKENLQLPILVKFKDELTKAGDIGTSFKKNDKNKSFSLKKISNLLEKFINNKINPEDFKKRIRQYYGQCQYDKKFKKPNG